METRILKKKKNNNSIGQRYRVFLLRVFCYAILKVNRLLLGLEKL